MILKNIIGAGAIAGAIGFSAIGLAGVANAAPTATQSAPAVVDHAQLANWGGGRGGGGWHGGGGGRGFGGRGFGGHGLGGRGFGGPGFGGRGFGGPGFGGPGFGGGGFGGPPCLIGGLCI